MTTEATPQGQITEDDLAKTLAGLSGQKPAATEIVPPQVVTPGVTGTEEAIRKAASEPLRKALDVSSVLAEIVEHIGEHVDESIGVLAKSIHAAAERDFAMIVTLENLTKTIAENTAAVLKYGDQPGTRPRTVTATAGGKVVVLAKGADQGGAEQTPEEAGRESSLIKTQVINGLTTLAKAAGWGTPEGQRLGKTIIKFESTGQITDGDLAAAKNAAGIKVAASAA